MSMNFRDIRTSDSTNLVIASGYSHLYVSVYDSATLGASRDESEV